MVKVYANNKQLSQDFIHLTFNSRV